MNRLEYDMMCIESVMKAMFENVITREEDQDEKSEEECYVY